MSNYSHHVDSCTGKEQHQKTNELSFKGLLVPVKLQVVLKGTEDSSV